MGLLQAAYRTFESQAHLAGAPVEGEETLAPVAHTVRKAQIEITIGPDGVFQDARQVRKGENKTIIPVTEESAGRTSGPAAHPLSDQLCYLSSFGGGKFEKYLDLIKSWAASEYSHPKVRAVLNYIEGGSILTDLLAAGVITLSAEGVPAPGKIEGSNYKECIVRFRVNPPPDGESSACWEDRTLFSAFQGFMRQRQEGKDPAFCMISGQEEIPAANHPKGVLAASFGAKLISANDSSGFTYRGRFASAGQAGSIGYTASQKAHSALHWLAVNHGTIMGGCTFLWWNPEGKPLPDFSFLGITSVSEEKSTFTSYQKKLRDALSGYGQKLTQEDGVVVAVLDAATTGRLSVTYYSEMKALDLLDRLQEWYDTCRWDTRNWDMCSPALKRIVQCAWGTQRGSFIEVDDRLLREHAQKLLHCVGDRRPIPVDIVRSLAGRASCTQAYSAENRELLLSTACAVIRKYHNDIKKKEVWTLALDESNTDRSYLFGRLLAVAEKVERGAYSRGEEREPNAMRMQNVFSQRPVYAWRILEEALEPYYRRLPPGLRKYYRDITQSIAESLNPEDPELNRKLDDVYLLGYYHQRSALARKKGGNENTAAEGMDYEPAEEQD